MTMPNERSRALIGAAELLKELLNPEKHPEITVETRRDIKWVLRHYPDRHMINAMALHCPDYLSETGEWSPQEVIPEAARAELVALRNQEHEKPTVDELIARLAPDRQAAVLAMAEKITQARNDARAAETRNFLTTANHSPLDSPSPQINSGSGDPEEGATDN